jgi:hypothetical protein
MKSVYQCSYVDSRAIEESIRENDQRKKRADT